MPFGYGISNVFREQIAYSRAIVLQNQAKSSWFMKTIHGSPYRVGSYRDTAGIENWKSNIWPNHPLKACGRNNLVSHYNRNGLYAWPVLRSSLPCSTEIIQTVRLAPKDNFDTASVASILEFDWCSACSPSSFNQYFAYISYYHSVHRIVLPFLAPWLWFVPVLLDLLKVPPWSMLETAGLNILIVTRNTVHD